MRGLSDDAADLFTKGTTKPHKVRTYVEIRLGGEPKVFPTVLGGSVTVDVGSAVRRRCSIDLLIEEALVPDREDDLLYPGKAHVHVWRGIDWGDGRPGTAWGASQTFPGVELWPLGVFFHTETVVRSGSRPGLTIGGGDLSRRVQRAGWIQPYVIPAGTDIAGAWEALILNRWPDADTSVITSVADTTGSQLVYGDKPKADPWADARKLAQHLGAESYVGPEGKFLLADVPDPLQQPISATYRASTDGSPVPLLEVERRLDADKGYSAVVVDSNRSGGTNLRAIAYDDDPASPTYYEGDYGLVPVFVSTGAGSQARVDAQAAGILDRKRAASDAITIELVANPAHEERDVIVVEDATTRVDALYSLDGFTMPLGAAESMKASVRKVLG